MEKKYISRYSSLQTTCADPWKIHKSTVKKSLRVLNDLDTAQSLGIKPGQKLCPTCLKRGKEIKNKCDTESLEETDEDLYESHEDLKEKLDTSFKSLGCSPIKTRNIPSKRSYCSRKVSQIASATKLKVFKVMDIDESEFDQKEGKTHHQSAPDRKNYDYSILSLIPGRSSKPAKSSVFLIVWWNKLGSLKKRRVFWVSLKARKDVLSILQQCKELERFMKTMNTRECARPRRNLYVFE